MFGIASPRILNKVNKSRNLLEHEYRKPKKDQVEDAIDAVTLFTKYTEKFLCGAKTGFRLSRRYKGKTRKVHVSLRYEKGVILFLRPKKDKLGRKTQVVARRIKADSREYSDYLAWVLGLYEF